MYDTSPIHAGYIAYNGYVFTQSDADRYNRRSADMERNRNYPNGLQRCLDARHKTFCLITGCND